MRIGQLQQLRQESRLEGLAEKEVAGGPIDDVGTVAREDKTAVLLEFQLTGEGGDAIGGTSGTEHEAHAGGLGAHQHLKRMRRDDFVGIRERAVEI